MPFNYLRIEQVVGKLKMQSRTARSYKLQPRMLAGPMLVGLAWVKSAKCCRITAPIVLLENSPTNFGTDTLIIQN